MKNGKARYTNHMTELTQLQDKLGYTFSNRDLLQTALTHRSYVNEHPDRDVTDNERMEFLGDAVLDFLTAEYLFQHCPEMREGQLTGLRVGLVRTETLASLAQSLDLGACLRLGRGEAASGGRDNLSNLCAAFEALVGAVALDAGIGQARALVFPFIAPLVEELLREADLKDAKTRLQELSQARSHLIPTYETIAESGPDHAKEFVVVVRLGDKTLGKGRGSSKQSAQQAAASAAIHRHFPYAGAPRRSRRNQNITGNPGPSKDRTTCI